MFSRSVDFQAIGQVHDYMGGLEIMVLSLDQIIGRRVARTDMYDTVPNGDHRSVTSPLGLFGRHKSFPTPGYVFLSISSGRSLQRINGKAQNS